MFLYTGFGLNIRSELELPELMPLNHSANQKFQVSISLGKNPTSLKGPDVIKKVRNWARPNEFLIWIKDIVSIHVINGDSINIEPLGKNKDWKSIRLFLLGSGFAALLHQRREYPLHASAVILDGSLVLFTGMSGVGKSTTALYLKKRGYPIFSDDVCVLRVSKDETNTVKVSSSYPMMRHWADTIDTIDSSDISKQYQVREQVLKYGNFFHDEFVPSDKPVTAIIEIQAVNIDDFAFEPVISNAAKLVLLRNNIFRKGQLDGLQGKRGLFETLTKICPDLNVYVAKRPRSMVPIEDFIDFIESELHNLRTTKTT